MDTVSSKVHLMLVPLYGTETKMQLLYSSTYVIHSIGFSRTNKYFFLKIFLFSFLLSSFFSLLSSLFFPLSSLLSLLFSLFTLFFSYLFSFLLLFFFSFWSFFFFFSLCVGVVEQVLCFSVRTNLRTCFLSVSRHWNWRSWIFGLRTRSGWTHWPDAVTMWYVFYFSYIIINTNILQSYCPCISTYFNRLQIALHRWKRIWKRISKNLMVY